MFTSTISRQCICCLDGCVKLSRVAALLARTIDRALAAAKGHVEIDASGGKVYYDHAGFRIALEMHRMLHTHSHPGVTFTILTAGLEEISEAVASGAADIGLGFTRFQHPAVRLRFETRTPFGAIVSPGHPLASLHYVTLDECAQYPIVRAHDPAGKAMFLEEETR